MVSAAAEGLSLQIPRWSVVSWLKRHAASFAVGAAMMAAVSSAAAYGVIGLQARAASVRSSNVVEAVTAARLEPPPPQPSMPQPSQRPARAQPPAPVPAKAATSRFTVLVGSFRAPTEAGVLLDQLRGLGYRTYTNQVASTSRGAWHQVFVGPYDDLDHARQDEARVRRLPGYADARLVTP
jgi:cell division septation protein DedD